MRILVTGGAGFIGSHVVDAYRTAGHVVAVLDNLSSGKKENLPSDIFLYHGNIQDVIFVRKVLEEFQPDVVNHHAAQISVTASVRDSFADADANVLGINALLMAMIEYSPDAKLIYATSGGAMYDSKEKPPYTESSKAEASSPYGLSKFVAEQYVWLYAKLHNLKATVLRYSNVYGPRQDSHGEGGVCAIFADRMVHGEPVTIFGDGTATRDYVFVGDVAQANVAALTRGDGEACNISTCVGVSTQEVYEEFKTTLSYDHPALYAPMRPGELAHSLLSSEKALKVLGWKPKRSFSAGVGITASWYLEGNKYKTLDHE